MTTFNRVTTGITHEVGRYRIWMTYENTETGETLTQLATRWYTDQTTAEFMAEQLARQVTDRLAHQ